jgi:putative CocE/NonD family hydrolase
MEGRLIVSAFPRAVRVIEHTLIPLHDGTTLAARIWLPEDAESRPVPAILEYLPYRKRDGTYERDAMTHPYLAGHGYAGVRVDIRGSGESGGLLFDEYTRQEQDDALEVIAWLAAQPWCSGAVGMMGISWGGFNALQVAARRPTALQAIVTICSTDDRYRDDVHYMGGTLLTAGLDWASFFFTSMCHPPDPALVGDRWRSMWLQRLEHVPLFLEGWLRHQRRDDFWRWGSVCEDYTAIQCPVYAVGGWTDGYKNAIPRLLEHLSVPRKGLIGPWAHAYPHFALPGPQIGFLQEILRWWDHWLKGIDTGVMDEPMLRAWMTESVEPASRHQVLPGRWVAEQAWPPTASARHRLFLTDAGLRPGGALETPRPMCSPQTVGKRAGEWCPFGLSPDHASDQREDDARSLVFESTPLVAPIEILGAATVTRHRVRRADRQPGSPALRCASVRQFPPRQLRRAQPDAPRWARNACAAGGRAALPNAYPAQRRRRGVSGRPQDTARAVHDVLADDLAGSGEADADSVRRHARPADTLAQGHRRTAAAARPGDGAARATDSPRPGSRLPRPDRVGTGQ